MNLLLALLVLQPQDDDLMLRVMRDEMDRSMKRLRMEKAPAPYHLEYVVRETATFQVRAAFGALAERGESRSRRLGVDLRVGDYALDNTNFGGESGWGGFGGWTGSRDTALTVDDDYDALRHAVWRASDEAYKEAVEDLEKKKAYLQENIVKDRPDDLSREEPFVLVKTQAKLEVDRDRWTEATRRLSAVFRRHPAVQNSLVMFVAEAETRWFLNSEGFKHRVGDTEVGVVIMAVAQAEDGMKVSDYEVFIGRTEKDLPPTEAIEKAADALAGRLADLAKAPHAEEYRGPILLEGQAAAEFFSQTLAPHLGNAHEPVGRKSGGNPLKDRIGQRVLPKSITVTDDPTLREFQGTVITGGWEVDDDGVAAQRIVPVEAGSLKTFCMSRIPTRHVKKSNGHSREGSGSTSTLVVESDDRRPAADLRKELIELGREEGLAHVYVARRVSNMLSSVLNPAGLYSMMMGGGGRGGVTLLPPILLYRVSVEDGKEELVRGARFGRLTMRVLRDIEATGDAPAAHPSVRGSRSASFVITPSVLLREIEINKPPEETEKPPALKNPLFEK